MQGASQEPLPGSGSDPGPVSGAARGIVVQKYGGSSVADPERLRRVADRVVATARAGYRVVVVVSAMGDTTDDLLALARRVAPSPPRRELDMLLSAGERISMALLSMAICELGQEAISFTGSQSGIITNDRHSGARILEVRPYRILDELDRGRIVIVAGFQGVSYKKEVTTLGRGGSDTTAVALAAALRAEFCEICSDVDGVYSADPRVVTLPRLLNAISHDEMQELAEHGAKVLNPQAVELAREAGILVYARATSGGGDGTRLGGSRDDRRGAVGVTSTTGLVALELAPTTPTATTTPTAPAGAASARAGELAQALAAEGAKILRLESNGKGGASALLTTDDLPDWSAVRERLQKAFGAGLSVTDDLALVTVVGEGLGRDPGALSRALSVAGDAGAKVAGVDASPLRLSLLVPPGNAPELVRALHAAFIG
jgi:aspartate kinase